ncbi:MAG: glycosyltransferase family 9 protein [Gammaproteobacteria bacterium]|nr:glycosyltransferase family 9 protein [Gammaproteobacteria bacterium]
MREVNPIASPLSNGYLVKTPISNLILRCIDTFWSSYIAIRNFFCKPSTITSFQTPTKVLLANIANLGDVIIATSIVAAIKHYYPGINIGFLAGSQSKNILANHPLVNQVHYFDHFYISRAKTSIWQKLWRHYITKRQALTEIKKQNYDVVIDLYAYFPNSIFLLWQSKIPVRVGYASGGFGPLLTKAKIWELENKHVAKYHLDLVRSVLANIPEDVVLKPMINCFDPVPMFGKIPETIKAKGYIILHPGSGAILRNWPIVNWRALKEQLLALGYGIVLTGLGAAEQELTDKICAASEDAINLCNKLSWQELVAVIAEAKLLVGVDSCASHITAAVDTPSVIIIGGMVNYTQWQPLTKLTKVLYKNLPCVPCYNKNGCQGMDCICGVEVVQVLSAISILCNK